MCIAIVESADMLGLAHDDDLAYELIPELRMFKPIDKHLNSFWIAFGLTGMNEIKGCTYSRH